MQLHRYPLTVAGLLAIAAPTFLVATLAPSTAAAAKKKAAPKPADKVVVVLAEGPDSEEIAQAVEAGLPKGLVIANKPELVAELAKRGQKGAFGKALDSSKTREQVVEKIKKAAEAAAVDVVIVLQVHKSAKARTVTVLIIDPKLSTLAREDEVTLAAKKPKDPSEDTGPVLESVKPTLDVLRPKAPEPTPEEAPDAPKDAPPPPDVKSDKPGVGPDKAFVSLHAGLDLGMRKFDYAGPVEAGKTCPPEGCTKLRPYSVSGAPMVALGADLFPLASQDGIVSGLGLYGSWGRAIGLDSAAQGGPLVSTVWNHYDVGAQLRIVLGDASSGPPSVVYLLVGYGNESFSFQGAGTIANEVPNAAYTFVRLGAAWRMPVSDRVAIRAGFSVLPSLGGGSPNSVAGRFNANAGGGKTSIFGFDLNLAIAVRIVGGLEANVSTRYTRQNYSFDSKNQDAHQATSASEQMVALARFGLSQSF